MEYDDGLVACAADALIIRRYTLLLRPRRIPYADIRSARQIRVGVMRRLRLWGSGDLRHWFNLDLRRPEKQVAFALDVGRGMQPTITPDDPDRVAEVLRSHGVHVTERA